MNIDNILDQLKGERDRLDRAIAALDGTVARRGRPATSNAAITGGRRRAGKPSMSATARKRMAALMRKRWAERKKAGKTRL